METAIGITNILNVDKIQAFDLVFFGGSEYVSDLIKFIQYHKLVDHSGGLIKPGSYSHVGMIVSTEVLNHSKMENGKLYILESTMGGQLGQGVYNIDGFKNVRGDFMGVQIRDFNEVISKYLVSEESVVSVGRLINNPLNWEVLDRDALKLKFTDIVESYLGTTYDGNCFSLCSAAFMCMRPMRYRVERLLGTEDWLFCSELVAQIYVDMGFFPGTVNPKNVLPMDFLGYDEDIECGVPQGVINLSLMIIKKEG